MKAKPITILVICLILVLLSVNLTLAQNSSVTTIALDGSAIAITGAGAIVDGSSITITTGGTYSLSGTLTDGQVAVDTEDGEPVVLILNGVDLHNSTSAPINIMNAETVEIVLAEGTQNYLSDADEYVYANPEDDEPNAALFSDDDLSISGTGSLTVEANYNDGIASKDSLVISDATITVNSIDDGIRGKDSLVISNANLTLTAGGDGLKSDEDEDASLGFINIESGQFIISAGGDAIQAETTVTIAAGTFNITTAGGSSAFISEDLSAKGIKAGVNVTINGGTYSIDSADDGVHSNDSIIINAGEFTIATGDDGMHADATLDVNAGIIDISSSYEGLESAIITINAGDIDIVSSDDGLNVAGGNDESGFGRRPGRGPGQSNFASLSDYLITINGGKITIDAGGDGIDANGSIEMNGGLVIVNGPTANMNSAIDYDGTFNISGGMLVGAGSSGMAQGPDQSSSQNSLLLNLTSPQQASTLVHIESAEGDTILTFAPTKAYQSIAFSSPDLLSGTSYTVYLGGSADGTASEGLYLDGSYVPGAEYANINVSSIVTQIGSTGNRGPGRR